MDNVLTDDVLILTYQKIKQYKGKNKYVILKTNEIICICKNEKDLADIISYLEGNSEVKIKDKNIKMKLDYLVKNYKKVKFF